MIARTLLRCLSLISCVLVLAACGGSGGGGGGAVPPPPAPPAPPAPPVGPTQFTHEASPQNAIGALTTLDHPQLNDNPYALMMVTPTANAGGVASDAPPRAPVGLAYLAAGGRWVITTQDGSPMDHGHQFQVELLTDPERSFFHENDEDTRFGVPSATVLDHPLLNDNPLARLFVTQYQNNGDDVARLVRNEDEVSVLYNGVIDRWMIVNQNQRLIPLGARFSVFVAPFGDDTMLHKVTVDNIWANGSDNLSTIDHPAANDNPDARLFLTLNVAADNGGAVYTRAPASTFWNPFTGRWMLRNSTDGRLPFGATYFVAIR